MPLRPKHRHGDHRHAVIAEIMDVSVDAAAGGKKRAQARPKGQGLQANRSCSASVRRHPAKLRHSQCSFYAIFIVGITLGIIGATLAQPPDHRINRILEPAFRPGLYRKMRPTLKLDSGTQFPPETSTGNGIPLWSQNPGHGFRSRADPESASHSEHSFWDALSAGS